MTISRRALVVLAGTSAAVALTALPAGAIGSANGVRSAAGLTVVPQRHAVTGPAGAASRSGRTLGGLVGTTGTGAPAAVPTVPTVPTVPPAVQAPALLSSAGLAAPAFLGSFWTTPLPADVPLDSRSAAMAADLNAQYTDYRTRYGYHATLNTEAYAPPVFTATATTPLVRVKGFNCQNKPAGQMEAWSDAIGDVPIPADARPAPGTDQEMVVWQPSTDTLWEFWVTSKTPTGEWQACWGGKLTHATASAGVFPYPFGTTASGLSLLGGLLTPDELASGVIPHALTVAIPSTAAEPVFPANRTDGDGPVATQLAEGSRFRLPLDYPVTGTPAQKAVIRALKTYGAVVRDRAGAIAFYGENVAAETGSGAAWSKALGGIPAYTLFDGIDWSKVQVVDPSVNRLG